MPIVVFVLAVAVFAQGTSEFMVSGLLGQITVDVGVSLGAAGLLTSLFAIGMVVGAPVMAMVAGRLPVRYSVTAFLALFCVAHIIGALATDFTLLLVTRIVAAVANAGFLATALAALPRLVGPTLIGRATAVIVSGVTVACIAGVPAGTLLGQVWGWRSAFWAVAVISAAALVPVWLMVPRGTHEADRVSAIGPSMRSEWMVLGKRPVRAAIVAGALVNAATFAGFTYLGTITAETTGTEGRWIPVVLALFGIGSFAGVTLTGRYSDHHRGRIVMVGTAVLVGVWTLAALTAHTLIGLAIMAVVAGAVAFGVGSTLIASIVRAAAPTAPRIAGALATTALNIGAVLGPATAGVVVDRTDQPTMALWCGAVFTLAATAVVLVGHWRGVGQRHDLGDGNSVAESVGGR
ncbi:MFS transporter [Nocardia uniformis]|uniref:MFS transporter n=1 Tax=Nocardia uniformis TaxID=53432 RepID=A0A849BWS8_9NOCA|nr:Cmx/CmrA family chloramphenicol efflux MFS transporter [Nocardia uniformis]NNH71053.1 MFS transporter [Nocardia uniformis]